MKVCQIISGDLWAGAEVMCLRLLKGLALTSGVELSAILLNNGKLALEIKKLGVPMNVIDETRLDFIRIAKRIHEIRKEFKPDILHTHRLKENILGFLSSREAGRAIPLVSTQHGLEEPHTRWKWKLLSRANLHILSRHFQKIVAVSEDMRTVLTEKLGLPARKVVLIYNGTEVQNRISPDKRNKPFVIGSAGRLFPIKDYPFLVEIAAEIHMKAKDVRFELAGEGPELERIVEKIWKSGLQEIFLLKGFVDEMSEFFVGLDLYINTSIHEGFPMSVLEAMSHGLPVVAPKEGGIKEVVEDGVQGFLIDGRDPKRFAQKCLLIYQDSILRQNMQAAAIVKVAREHSIEQMAGKYFELYNTMLSETEDANLQ